MKYIVIILQFLGCVFFIIDIWNDVATIYSILCYFVFIISIILLLSHNVLTVKQVNEACKKAYHDGRYSAFHNTGIKYEKWWRENPDKENKHI